MWKGRKLHFPGDRSVRPTLGRARITLFNWLAGAIEGRRCLDLFAGSGALGFEAHSRGAAHTTLVDADRSTIAALRDNAARFRARNLDIRNADAVHFLEENPGPWDLVFLDPPYDSGLLVTVLSLLESCIEPGGLVYCESREHPSLPRGWETLKQLTLSGGSMTLLTPSSQTQS